MTTTRAAAATALIISVLVAIASADAQTRRFSARVSGSFVTTELDTDGAGSKAVFTHLEGTSTLGTISGEGVGEWLALGVQGSCPAGSLESTLVSATGVLRAASGDLIYTRFTSGTSCADPATGIATYHTEGEILGERESSKAQPAPSRPVAPWPVWSPTRRAAPLAA